jgi:NADH:ubiquinone oxidoreductase subunit 6 (subunit J)
MTYQVSIMYVVAAILLIAGVAMLLRLRSSAITERKTYAYRMIGIMLASAGIVLGMSATAMWQWSMPETLPGTMPA